MHKPRVPRLSFNPPRHDFFRCQQHFTQSKNSQTSVTPPYFYTFHKLAFISHSAVLWFNMVESATVLGEIFSITKVLVRTPYWRSVFLLCQLLQHFCLLSPEKWLLCRESGTPLLKDFSSAWAFKSFSLNLLNAPSVLTFQQRGPFLILTTCKSYPNARCRK